MKTGSEGSTRSSNSGPALAGSGGAPCPYGTQGLSGAAGCAVRWASAFGWRVQGLAAPVLWAHFQLVYVNYVDIPRKT